MLDIIRDFLNSPRWLILVILGVLIAVCGAAVGTADIYGVHIDLKSPLRYGALIAIGILLMGFGLLASRTEQREADLKRLPIEGISIKEGQTSRTPYLHVPVSGEVTPKKPGVNVWLFRQDLAGRTGDFNLAVGHATTDDNGHWEHKVSLWGPGPFRVRAVVTTKESESFFRLYQRAFDAALKVRQQQEPNTYSVLGWPNFEALPEASISAYCRVTLES